MAEKTLQIAPFLRSEKKTDWMRAGLGIALLPPVVWGTVLFGFRVPVLLLLGAGSAVLVRFLWNLISHARKTEDLSGAALTGGMTLLCMSVTCSYYLAVLCGAFASVIRILTQRVSWLALHPVALTVLLQSIFFPCWYPQQLTQKVSVAAFFVKKPAAVAAAPLETLLGKQIPDVPVLDLILGNHAGAMGEVSAVLLLIGFVYLCSRQLLKWKGTVQYLLAAALTAFLFPVTLDNFGSMWAELFCGATVFAAVYLAGDDDTAPKTDTARTVYYIGCGVLSVFLRSVISFADGVFLALLCMGLVSRLLDKYLGPRMFGRGKAVKRDLSGDGIDDLLAEIPEEAEETFNPRKE